MILRGLQLVNNYLAMLEYKEGKRMGCEGYFFQLQEVREKITPFPRELGKFYKILLQFLESLQGCHLGGAMNITFTSNKELTLSL